MIAREAVLSDPEIVKFLSSKFVPVAVDNVGNPNVTAAERSFLKARGGDSCTQGMSVFTADGKVLGMGGGFQPEPVKELLKAALAKFTPQETTLEIPMDKESLRNPPEGGLVLFVTWKVLWGPDPPKPSSRSAGTGYEQIFRDSLGVDRLWVRKDEAEALAKGAFPESLQRRMTRCHFRRFFGDEPITLELRERRITGRGGARSGILGFVEAKDGRISRLDLVVKAPALWIDDHGFSGPLTVAAKDRPVTLAMAFTLADRHDELARVYPHALHGEDYLR